MTHKAFAQAVGNNIKAELRRKGRTQAEAAQLLGLKSQSAVSERLNGDVRLAFDEVMAIAEWLDVPLDALLRDVPSVASTPTDGMPAHLLTRSLHPLALAA